MKWTMVLLTSFVFAVPARADEPKNQDKKACDNGSAVACNKAGNKFFAGKDWEAAAVYYDKACDGKILEACHGLAMSYAKRGNPILTKFYLGDACDLGHKQSCDELKDLKKIEQENASDAEAYSASVDKKYEDEEKLKAQEKALQEENEKKEAVEREEKLKVADKGCVAKKGQSCLNAGHEKYKGGDEDAAVTYFEKACDLTVSEGCRLAGIAALEKGSEFYGDRLLKEACEMKNRQACKDIDKALQLRAEAKVNKQRELEEQRDRENQANQDREYQKQQALIEEQDDLARQRSRGQMLQNWGTQMMQQSRPTMCRSVPNGLGGFTTICN